MTQVAGLGGMGWMCKRQVGEVAGTTRYSLYRRRNEIILHVCIKTVRT